MRRQEKLPVSKIETDSFIIVQLLEQAGSIGFQTLHTASEQLAGSFTYTILDGGGRLYIVRGNNPFCLYHWPERGLYLYASTQAVLDAAVSLPENDKPCCHRQRAAGFGAAWFL